MPGIITFSKNGFRIADIISNNFSSKIYYFGKESIKDYIQPNREVFIGSRGVSEEFGDIYNNSDGIVFISACGIAIRLIKPYIKNKKIDKPIVVIDDGCRYSIALLAGHEGGANKLASDIGSVLRIESIITTGTESGKNIIVGIGLRKGVASGEIKEALEVILNKNLISLNKVRVIASIDIKSKEKGLIEIADKLHIPLRFIESEKIKKLEHNVSFSKFVKKKIGVGNVCESAAILAGVRTEIVVPKTVFRRKITVAIAREKFLWEE